MDRKWLNGIFILTGLSLILTVVIAGGAQSASPAPSTHAPAAPASAPSLAGRTAEQAFKNIQVLKGAPADQLIPAMQFITASLGV